MSEPYLSPARPRKAAEVVARRIVAHITEHQLPPGTVLPQEPQMQAAFGVGRSTLREALRLLETQGVLSLKAGRGPEVRRPTPEYLLNSLTLLLEFQDATLGTLLGARALFEPAIAAEAARHITDDDIEELRRNVAEVRSGELAFRQLVHRELDFHRVIARCSKNVFAETIVATLAAAMSSEAFEIARNHDVRQDLSFHDRIVETLAARDAEGAEAAMREHLQSIFVRVRKSYPQFLEQPVRWM